MSPTLFGREIDDGHTLAQGLAEMTSHDIYCGSMARNLMHDRRISEERATAFIDYISVGSTVKPDRVGIQNGLCNYFRDRVRHASPPAFLLDDNWINVLNPPFEKPRIKGDTPLVRILDISGLRMALWWAKSRGVAPFDSEPDASFRSEMAYDSFLARFLESSSDSRKLFFVSAILEALKQSVDERRSAIASAGSSRPFHPVWAGLWDEFAETSNAFLPTDAPNRWLEMFGISRPWANRWIIALKYPINCAGTLVRPTILDAGWHPAHFPSPSPPPNSFVSVCGHPVDLDLRHTHSRLIHEIIHEECTHSLEHWVQTSAIGGQIGLLGKTTRVTSDQKPVSFRRAREFHLEIIRDQYGICIGWMQPPV